MGVPISTCPACSGSLEPVKLRCKSCDLALEGTFSLSRLGFLDSAQQRFVESFLVARGNIKEVERELGISYPTVRKRLEEVVVALGHAPEARRKTQMEILDAIESGEMSSQEGIRQMKEAGRR